MLEALQRGWKQREPRRSVIIPCRMHAGPVWVDVVLHNISSRGCLVRSADAPAPGTYVDIRRGTQIIIGRVMWRTNNFFGVRSQQRIDIAAIIDEPRLVGRPQAALDKSAGERRAASRLSADAAAARRLERSRRFSSAIQFGTLMIGGVVAAGFAATQVYEVLAQPFDLIEAHLPAGR